MKSRNADGFADYRMVMGLHRIIVLGVVALAPVSALAAHWAYVKPVEPAAPSVKDAGWVKNPVDAFVLAKLEEAGLKPAAPIDKRSLIRRAYFDLIGLPPTPEAVDAFLADKSDDAFAKVVDGLLADPRYGERWGRYWLDVARYSDVKGYIFTEERRYPYAYTYRDYVIRSLNEDKPYDRFLVEQIAADLLPLGDDKRPLAAMGFLTLGRRFLNVQPDIIDDRMDVVCRGTMAVTIGCARCHNHKFDPIPSTDYYSLYSIFNNSIEPKDQPLIGEPEHDAAYDAYKRELDRRNADVEAYRKSEYDRLVPALRSAVRISEYLLVSTLEHVDEEAYLSNVGANPYVHGRWRAYLLDLAKHHDPIFEPWRVLAALPEAQFAARAGEALDAARKQPLNSLVAKAFEGDPPRTLAEAASRYGALLAQFDKPDALPSPDEEALRQVLRGEGAPTNLPLADIENVFKRDSRDHLRELHNKVDALRASNTAAPPRAMVLQDSPTNEPQHVFLRGNAGNWGPEVKPHFLTCLAGDTPPTFTHGSGRLEFAEAIASKDNPLTARVMVNRVWLHHFGYGIVRTPSDFGTRSDPPTHPQLLDYLALRFEESGWSIKKLHRLIMLSATYQLGSDASPEASQRDPQNLLLSHFNRQRLDFEATRDSLLFASGTLDPRIYGRSVDIMAEPFSNRRTVYAYIDRQNLPGVFRSFDFASPDTHCPRRFQTTVPQQALFMMNGPFFMEQVKHLVARPQIAAESDPRKKIELLYRTLFDRAPADDELQLGLGFVANEERESRDAVVWRYGYGEFDDATRKMKSFTPMPHFTGHSWQGSANIPDAKLGWMLLFAEGGHPGNDHAHAVIRRWTSPIDGQVKISGTIAHGQAQGDGVHAQIVSSRGGELASWNVFNGQAQTELDSVDVKAGDTIDFVVDCRGNFNNDSFTWAPVVEAKNVAVVAGSDAPQRWDARAGFGSSRTASVLSPWEKYAQVLLQSNEFAFVD